MAINNSIIYNAAYSGAVGAIEAGRMIRSPLSARYADIATTATAFATAVDALIAPNASFTSVDGDLMLSACVSIMTGRYTAGVIGFVNGSFSPGTSNFTIIANAIVALFVGTRGALSPAVNYGSQSAWAIDPLNGNDANIGTPAEPLATMTEFNVRYAALLVSVAATLQLVGDVTDAPLWLRNTNFGTGASLTVNGTRTAVTAAVITITVATGLGASATNPPWLITTTGIDWTTVPLTTQVRVSTGQICAISEVVGANQVVLGAFCGTGTSVALVTPTIGSTITLSALSKALPIVVNATGQFFTNIFQLSLQDLSFNAPSSVTNAYVHTGGINIQYYGCQLAMPSSTFSVNTPFNIRGCRVTATGTMTWRAGTSEAVATFGLVVAGTGALIMNLSGGSMSHSSICMNGMRLFCTGSIMTLSGHIRNTAAPIVIQNGGFIQIQGVILTGANNTGIGVDVPSGRMEYFSSTKPTLTGATDSRIGGQSKTWAQVPFINATLDAIPPTVTTLTGNLACIVLGS